MIDFVWEFRTKSISLNNDKMRETRDVFNVKEAKSQSLSQYPVNILQSEPGSRWIVEIPRNLTDP